MSIDNLANKSIQSPLTNQAMVALITDDFSSPTPIPFNTE